MKLPTLVHDPRKRNSFVAGPRQLEFRQRALPGLVMGLVVLLATMMTTLIVLLASGIR